jgi:hypothetical protein
MAATFFGSHQGLQMDVLKMAKKKYGHFILRPRYSFLDN